MDTCPRDLLCMVSITLSSICRGYRAWILVQETYCAWLVLHYPVFVEDTEHKYLSKRPTVHG